MLLIIVLLALAFGLMIAGAIAQRRMRPAPQPRQFDQFTNWRGMRR